MEPSIAAWRGGSREYGGIFVLCSQNGKRVFSQTNTTEQETTAAAGIELGLVEFKWADFKHHQASH